MPTAVQSEPAPIHFSGSRKGSGGAQDFEGRASVIEWVVQTRKSELTSAQLRRQSCPKIWDPKIRSPKNPPKGDAFRENLKIGRLQRRVATAAARGGPKATLPFLGMLIEVLAHHRRQIFKARSIRPEILKSGWRQLCVADRVRMFLWPR
jgi:hypothetical protein